MANPLDYLTELAEGGSRTVNYNPLWDMAQQYAPGYFNQVQSQFGQAPAGTQVNQQAQNLADQGYQALQQQLQGGASNQAVQRAATAATQPFAQSGTLGGARSQLAAATAGANVANQAQQQAIQNIPAVQQAQFAPAQQQQQAQQDYIRSYYDSLGLGQAPSHSQSFRTPSTLEALGGSADLIRSIWETFDPTRFGN